MEFSKREFSRRFRCRSPKAAPPPAAARITGTQMSGLWASGPSRRRSVGGGDSTKDRRPRLKALAAESAQERRRQEFISNQKRVRGRSFDGAVCSLVMGVYSSRVRCERAGCNDVCPRQVVSLVLSAAVLVLPTARQLSRERITPQPNNSGAQTSSDLTNGRCAENPHLSVPQQGYPLALRSSLDRANDQLRSE